jgi:hypothetical protein
MENYEPLPDNLVTAIDARVGFAPSPELGVVRILIGLTNQAGKEQIYAMSVDVAAVILASLSEFILLEPVSAGELN